MHVKAFLGSPYTSFVLGPARGELARIYLLLFGKKTE